MQKEELTLLKESGPNLYRTTSLLAKAVQQDALEP